MEAVPVPDTEAAMRQLTVVTGDCVQALLIAAERAKLLATSLDDFKRLSVTLEQTTNAIGEFMHTSVTLEETTRKATALAESQGAYYSNFFQQESQTLAVRIEALVADLRTSVTDTVGANDTNLAALKDHISTLQASFASLGDEQRQFAQATQASRADQIKALVGFRWESRILWIVVAYMLITHLVHTQ